MALESSLKDVLDVLPIDLASRVEFLIVLLQAVGGLFVIYFIYTLVKFFMMRKEEKIIEEIRNDVKYIKSRLKNKKR